MQIYELAFYLKIFKSIKLRKKIPRPIIFNASLLLDHAFKISKSLIVYNYKKNFVNLGISILFLKKKNQQIQNFTLTPEINLLLFEIFNFKIYLKYCIGGLTYSNSKKFKLYKIPKYLFNDYIGFKFIYKQYGTGISFDHFSDWFLAKGKGYDIPFLVKLYFEKIKTY